MYKAPVQVNYQKIYRFLQWLSKINTMKSFSLLFRIKNWTRLLAIDDLSFETIKNKRNIIGFD